MSARETALCALIACRRDGAWSNGVLKEYISRDGLDRRDAALAARLAYGVLQNRYRLDFYLKQLLTGKLRDLHPVVRDILHLGLYQIYDLDRIPDTAAVSESVELAKKYCKKQRFAPGLVNGVLRSAVQTRLTLKEPVSLEDKYSHPWELIKLLRDYVGNDRIEAMLQADNQTPPTVVQVNTLKTSADALLERLRGEHVQARPHGWMPDCLVLSGTGDLEGLRAWREGWFTVQDAAAKLTALAAAPKAGSFVIDTCAAPGGKSFAMAMCMEGKGHILSCDVEEHKLRLMEAGAERLGIECMEVRLADGRVCDEALAEKADVVVCDVPCSGLGIIRKKPDIRYKDMASLAGLPAIQSAILDNASRYVRRGGTLVYSTCTVLPEENERVTDAFLRAHQDFTYDAFALPDPIGTVEGHITLWPQRHGTDGFYICRMTRKE